MRNFQKRQNWKNIARSRPVLVFLAVLLLFFAYGVIGFMGKMELTRENRKIAENKVAQLEKEKARLSSDISKLNSQNGVEKSIREKFGLAKDGEGVIVILEDKNEIEVPKQESGGFFSFLKNLFK